MTRIVVTAEVRPSEDEDKVKVAIAHFFTFKSVKYEEGRFRILVAESPTLASLTKLHRALREERILDAARKYLRRGMEGDRLTFMIHKQAASVGRLTFIDSENESPLGPITFTVFHRDLEAVVDWLAPRTSRGRPLWENPIPED
ncbi:RNA-binding domain-containing protein [Metallosphaera hakonensis]|uniref:UPF0201 protein DFR87_09710 n=1 Tax=Metallosphaera hakonensis JCM 8857 = DSM 7519 TaxID=1293036 RepID=A0A2U9IVL8_9CREN|nr:RNA-binding domain-containing protein [Metallosphaera hakonensis]AWR99917.1 hypothetical protein DFR87_09710 [Metallosphaera hakonensis JCM 8857 = DSM 7519]